MLPHGWPVLQGVGHLHEAAGERFGALFFVGIFRPFTEPGRRLGQQRLGVARNNRAYVSLPVGRRVARRIELVLQAIDDVGVRIAGIFAQVNDAIAAARAGEIAKRLGHVVHARGGIFGLALAILALHVLVEELVERRGVR